MTSFQMTANSRSRSSEVSLQVLPCLENIGLFSRALPISTCRQFVEEHPKRKIPSHAKQYTLTFLWRVSSLMKNDCYICIYFLLRLVYIFFFFFTVAYYLLLSGHDFLQVQCRSAFIVHRAKMSEHFPCNKTTYFIGFGQLFRDHSP